MLFYIIFNKNIFNWNWNYGEIIEINFKIEKDLD